MTDHPEKLSDSALAAAIIIAEVRCAVDGRLGPRTELANLQAEWARRIEVLMLEQLRDAS